MFLDESGIEDNACREHGWSPKGERCYGEKSLSAQTQN
ncbi:transposase [Rickettsia endosymbiont of Ixodes scapularis]|nr:transposase [Rickettsia endosymbiont of Ixodes scapularis]